ncbi:MAG: hypothetical protein L0Z53_15240 [Acidobacteriales bacterium]|nr:hypothetical protein [Terriglobales bacterium]
MNPGASVSPAEADKIPVEQALQAFYRYPRGLFEIQRVARQTSHGFFRFGGSTCFGGCALPGLSQSINSDPSLPEALIEAVFDSGRVGLPFDPSEVADNLRLERYPGAHTARKSFLDNAWIRRAYYLARKVMPVNVRKYFQRTYLSDWHQIAFPSWPVDCSVELMFERVLGLGVQSLGATSVPFIWFWPEGYSACTIMTHDVEYAAGRDFCARLMDLDESAGIRSSFQVIPEGRYDISPGWLQEIRMRGHEINIHDLNHDGHLFPERERFLDRAEKIRAYAQQFAAEGFRSGALYRNLEWYDGLSFSYDMSVPNVAHLDPQRGGCCTVMPYFIGDVLELPLTATQDYSLFHILGDYSLDLWERQMEIVLGQHGLLSFNIHPDYVIEDRARAIYVGLLGRLADLRRRLNLWAPLPAEVNAWWRLRSQMEIIRDSQGNWRIVGEGSERARLAYASVHGDRLLYKLES